MLAKPDLNPTSKQTLEALSLADIVEPCPPLISPQTSIMEAAQAMKGLPVSCVIVADQRPGETTILGLITEQEVLEAVAAGIDIADTPVSLTMVAHIPVLSQDASLGTALQVLQGAKLRYVPVVNHQGQVCGLASRQTLYRTALDQLQTHRPRLEFSTLAAERGDEAVAIADPNLGLTTLTHLHYQLLSLHSQNRLRVYTRCLRLLGLACGASQAALFEVHGEPQAAQPDRAAWVSVRAAWARQGRGALLDHSPLQNMPYPRLQRWHGVLAKGGVLSGTVASFPAVEQEWLEPLSTQSVLLVPLRYRCYYFGFLLFSRDRAAPAWGTDTVKLLRAAAISLSLSIEQHRIRDRLQQTETVFASLFHQIPDPIAITTFPAGQYLLVNQGYAQWIGHPEAGIIGQYPRDLGLIPNRRQFAHLRQRLLQTGAIKNAEIDLATADGDIKTLLISSELTEFYGQTCLLSIGKDITQRKQIQSTLSAAEARFRAIFEQVSVGICQATLEGQLMDANPGLCQMLGYSHEQLAAKTFQGITHPEDLGMDLMSYERLLAGEVPSISLEKRYLHRDGRSIWVALMVCLVRNDQGEPLFSIGVSQDISDRKAAEMALRRSEERFALAIQDSKVGVWDWHPATDELYISPNLLHLLGYNPSPNTMAAWQAHIFSEDVGQMAAALARHLEGVTDHFEHTYRLHHQDGSLHWILSRGQRIGDGETATLRMAGTHTDITAMKQAETALQESHQHITDILESITDAFFALDRQSRFTYLNQRAEQFLQRSRQELLGQSLWYEFPEVLGTLFSKRFRQAMVERQSTTFEEYFTRSKSWYEVHVYPTQEGLAVYFQDITSRRLAYQKIEHQIRREQALNRVIQAIRQSLDLDTIFETAAREVAHLLQVDQVNIQRYQLQSLVWQVVAEYRANPDSPSLLHAISSTDAAAITQRLQQGQIVPLNSAHDRHPLTHALPGYWLLVPLLVSEALPWGCLGIHRPSQEGEAWQRSDIELVKIVADQLAIAIQQAQTLEQARRELEERQRAEARLKEAQRIAHTGNWELHLPTRAITWSEEMFRIYGLDPFGSPLSLEEQLAALEESDRPHWRHHLAVACLDGQPINLEGTIICPNGCRRFVQLLGQVQRNEQGTVIGLVGTLTDITERKQIEERLAYEALHDPLTGIPNRACFMEQLNAAVQRSKQPEASAFAVLFIDLDRFKVINDSLGHLVGDQLLIECASRLGSVVREEDLVARLGGDEFAILLTEIATIDDPVKVANRIHEVLQAPVTLEGREIFISASVGVSSNLTGSVEAVDFLRDADTAMYQAKNNGRGRSALFDPQMYEQVTQQLTLESDLQRALERDELMLHYQPIVNLRNGQLVGFEALVRWQHPCWGVIAPSTFIPLAEETGLIFGIGEWTQKNACQQLQRWHQTLPQASGLIMSVNLSVKQFASPRLITSIDEALQATNLNSHSLRLEITESALIENPDTAESLLLALQERGIQLCIDDFGTGYSSLSMVHRFPVQILKIDRSFTNRIEADHRGAAMIQAILALANSLGMTAIAEGVETDAQLVQLRQFGCPYAQGYRFSRPLTAEAAEQLLRDWPWSGSALDEVHRQHNESRAT